MPRMSTPSRLALLALPLAFAAIVAYTLRPSDRGPRAEPPASELPASEPQASSEGAPTPPGEEEVQNPVPLQDMAERLWLALREEDLLPRLLPDGLESLGPAERSGLVPAARLTRDESLRQTLEGVQAELLEQRFGASGGALTLRVAFFRDVEPMASLFHRSRPDKARGVDLTGAPSLDSYLPDVSSAAWEAEGRLELSLLDGFIISLSGDPASAEGQRTRREVARALTRGIYAQVAASNRADAPGLPPEGMVPGSVRVERHPFGCERVAPAHVATYVEGDDELVAFTRAVPRRAEAEAQAEALADCLEATGGRRATDEEGARWISIEILDAWTLVTVQDRFIAGVHMAPERRAAERLITRIIDHPSTAAEGAPRRP
jgi:hypothetical protein